MTNTVRLAILIFLPFRHEVRSRGMECTTCATVGAHVLRRQAGVVAVRESRRSRPYNPTLHKVRDCCG
jgi:hypothetical protein